MPSRSALSNGHLKEQPLLPQKHTSRLFILTLLLFILLVSVEANTLSADCTGSDRHTHLGDHHHQQLKRSTDQETQADSANSAKKETLSNTITMSGWNGKFELESSENFDEFLKALGVGFILRNAAKMSTPTVEITNEGEAYSMKTVTTFKTSEIKFNLGQEFDETRMDGVTVKTTVTKDGEAKLVQKQSGEPPCEIVRELVDDGAKLKTVCKTGEVISTRVYKRL